MVEKYIQELEKTYDSKATVIVLQDREEDGLVYNDVETIKYENIACAISHKSYYPPIQTEVPRAVMQIKIYMSNKYDIAINSKIIITDKYNRVRTYKSSSIPAIFNTHQEIIIEQIDVVGNYDV